MSYLDMPMCYKDKTDILAHKAYDVINSSDNKMITAWEQVAIDCVCTTFNETNKLLSRSCRD